MARNSKIKIVFPQGGIIPKKVLKTDEDQNCEPGEVVAVPAAYGEQLIRDRFAEEPTKPAQKSTSSKAQKPDLDTLESAVVAAKKDLAEAGDDAAKKAAAAKLASAEKALTDAKA